MPEQRPPRSAAHARQQAIEARLQSEIQRRRDLLVRAGGLDAVDESIRLVIELGGDPVGREVASGGIQALAVLESHFAAGAMPREGQAAFCRSAVTAIVQAVRSPGRRGLLVRYGQYGPDRMPRTARVSQPTLGEESPD